MPDSQQLAGSGSYLFSVSPSNDQAEVAKGMVMQERRSVRGKYPVNPDHQGPQAQHPPAMQVAGQVPIDGQLEPVQNCSFSGEGSASISS